MGRRGRQTGIVARFAVRDPQPSASKPTTPAKQRGAPQPSLSEDELAIDIEEEETSSPRKKVWSCSI